MSMTESVKLVIEAEDKASEELHKISKGAKESGKNLKDMGDQGQKSSTLLASALSATPFGPFLSQIALMSDTVKNYGEQTEKAAASSKLFAAVMGVAVFTAATNVGKAIGDLVFQTKRWKDELTAVKNEIALTEQKQQDILRGRLAGRQEEINLLGFDPAEQSAKIKKFNAELDRDIKQIGQRRTALQNKIKEMEGDTTFGFQSQNHKANMEQLREERRMQGERLAILQQVKAEVNATDEFAALRQRGEVAKESEKMVAKLRQEIDVLNQKRMTEEESIKLQASRAVGQEDVVKALLIEKANLQKEIAAKEKSDMEVKAAARNKELQDQQKMNKLLAEANALSARNATAEEKANQARLKAVQLKALGMISQEDFAREISRIESASGGTVRQPGPLSTIESRSLTGRSLVQNTEPLKSKS
jgi:chromosome segregation ATPase